MPAKLVPYVVMMPEGWEPKWCWESYRHVNHTCSKCLEVYTGTDNPCPLANAKKAVECGYADSLGAHMIATPKGKALSLYSVEMEDIK